MPKATNDPTTPSHWPQGLRYLTEPCYHPSVPVSLQTVLRPSSNRSSISANRSPSLVAIRPIKDSSHPAFGQCGLFAAKKIPPKTHILDYLGEVHCDDRPDSDYDLSLYRTQDLSVGVDASQMGNEGRFINDFRGVKTKPNAIFEERRTSANELCMSVWSGADPIKKGDEILVSYGKSWWKERGDT
ncbi:hypothetical protein QCA50_001515 [Cerrena zonata]|uniref:SET domain-containing protein n=1 Tax=Cerrena zonata TaxID=2478898 RepID=A0AAW0GW15_9APHY